MRPAPHRPTGGSGIVLILILALLAVGLLFWARSAHSPRAPAPSSTGVPPSVPASTRPTPQR